MVSEERVNGVADRRKQWLLDGAVGVFSAPQTVFFGGEYAAIAGSVTVVQNIGPRLGASWRPLKSGSGPEIAWSAPGIGRPEPWHVEFGVISDFRTLIGVACNWFRLRSDVEIRVVSEGVPSGGANASGALCVGVAACLMHASGHLEEKDIRELCRIRPDKLASAFNRKRFLDRREGKGRFRQDFGGLAVVDKLAALFFLAWSLEAHFHGGMASGYGAFCPLIHSRYPFVFFPEERAQTKECFSPRGRGRVVRRDPAPYNLVVARGAAATSTQPGSIPLREFIPRVAGNMARLRVGAWEIVSEADRVHRPFCWGVVYTGVTKHTGHQITKTGEMPDRRLACVRNVIAKANACALGIPPGRQAFRGLDVGRVPSVVLADPRLWELEGIVIELHEAMRRALVDGDSADLAKVMRRNQGALQSWGLDWWEGHLVASEIYRAAGKDAYACTAVKLTGAGSGGCLVFVAPEACRERIRAALHRLESRLSCEGVSVVYFPPEPFPNVPGLRVEKGRGSELA